MSKEIIVGKNFYGKVVRVKHNRFSKTGKHWSVIIGDKKKGVTLTLWNTQEEAMEYADTLINGYTG